MTHGKCVVSQEDVTKGLTGLTCVTTSQAESEEAHALNAGREVIPGREMEEVGRSLEQARSRYPRKGEDCRSF